VLWTRSFLFRLSLPYVVSLIVLAATGLTTWTGAAIAATVGVAAVLLLARAVQRRVGRLTEFSVALVEERELPDLVPQQDAFGRLERNLVGMGRTLSTRLESLREEKSKLQAILSGMVEGVLVIDPGGRIQMTNGRAEQIFGPTEPSGLVGRLLINLSRDPDLAEFVRGLALGSSSDPVKREITLKRSDREEYYQVTATRIPGVAGEPQLFILVFHDVTELKRLEATRRDFVGNVSHEIRTPLTAVRGYAETLRSGAITDPERADKFLRVIERHSERLSRLTDDLLALSDLELGRVALHRASMHLGPVVDASLDVVREKAGQGRVAVRHELPPDLPRFVADADRVTQILVNLVDNAVKYTEPGGEVVVTARTLDEMPAVAGRLPDVGPWLEIRVSDTGVGIPSRDLPRLTERFYRVDKARSRALGGTGLGLAIVKHIVQAHGGVLHIDSELGRGTTVSVLLPRGDAAQVR
jgi:two-component system phosphate regulon sensor histidine kinase PhoR